MAIDTKDTLNRFLVGSATVKGEPRVVIGRLPVPLALTQQEAANLAAYLVAIGFIDRADFLALLQSVNST